MAFPLCLILAAALQGSLTRAPGPLTRPGPLLLRLRRLEEQVGARGGEGVLHSLCQGDTQHFGLGREPARGVGSPHIIILSPCSFSGSRR